MKAEKLTEIKKELADKSDKELIDLTLRLAKYKKENKELLSYLLYHSHDPMNYAESLKSELQNEFLALQQHYYYSTKNLRKVLRTLNRHIKYTASKQVEAELLIWFCKHYILYISTPSHIPLRNLLTKQLEKISKLNAKLHEDLQFDYQHELNMLIESAETKYKWLRKKDLKL